jgi:hypothetical protein
MGEANFVKLNVPDLNKYGRYICVSLSSLRSHQTGPVGNKCVEKNIDDITNILLTNICLAIDKTIW